MQIVFGVQIEKGPLLTFRFGAKEKGWPEIPATYVLRSVDYDTVLVEESIDSLAGLYLIQSEEEFKKDISDAPKDAVYYRGPGIYVKESEYWDEGGGARFHQLDDQSWKLIVEEVWDERVWSEFVDDFLDTCLDDGKLLVKADMQVHEIVKGAPASTGSA